MSSHNHSQQSDHRNNQMEVQPKQFIKNKLFVTNLQGQADTTELEDRLKELFKNYGTLATLVVKKSRNAEYCFAFVQYAPEQDAAQAIQKLDQMEILGKKMKVQYQSDDKRRKDVNKGCYICGKIGHFARDCKYKNDSGRYQRFSRRSVSRSRSRSRDHKKKHKKRRHSSSSERSRTPKKKKQKKDRSRSKDQKKKKHKKKHKKQQQSDQ